MSVYVWGIFFTINSTRGIFKYVMMRLQEMIFVQIVLYIHFYIANDNNKKKIR